MWVGKQNLCSFFHRCRHCFHADFQLLQSICGVWWDFRFLCWSSGQKRRRCLFLLLGFWRRRFLWNSSPACHYHWRCLCIFIYIFSPTNTNRRIFTIGVMDAPSQFLWCILRDFRWSTLLVTTFYSRSLIYVLWSLWNVLCWIQPYRSAWPIKFIFSVTVSWYSRVITSRPVRCMCMWIWMWMLVIPWPCVLPILVPSDSPSLSTILLRTWGSSWTITLYISRPSEIIVSTTVSWSSWFLTWRPVISMWMWIWMWMFRIAWSCVMPLLVMPLLVPIPSSKILVIISWPLSSRRPLPRPLPRLTTYPVFTWWLSVTFLRPTAKLSLTLFAHVFIITHMFNVGTRFVMGPLVTSLVSSLLLSFLYNIWRWSDASIAPALQALECSILHRVLCETLLLIIVVKELRTPPSEWYCRVISSVGCLCGNFFFRISPRFCCLLFLAAFLLDSWNNNEKMLKLLVGKVSKLVSQ